MKRDFLTYHNFDHVYYVALVNSAADAFVKGAENKHLGVLLGMLNEQTIDDYRNAVARKGGNATKALFQLFSAHLQGMPFQADRADGAAIMARLAAAPADDLIPDRGTAAVVNAPIDPANSTDRK